MTKKVGRNDPCPCGSGKKYKKCCELKTGPKRKFQASIISSGDELKERASKISTDFFNRPPPPKKELRKPDPDKPNPEEPQKPM